MTNTDTSGGFTEAGNVVEDIEQLKRRLIKKDKTIQRLKQLLRSLKKSISEGSEGREILRTVRTYSEASSHSDAINTPTEEASLPFEILKIIFYKCDAQTRCRFTCMNKRTEEEFTNWVDVQNLYLTRFPIIEKNNKTEIVHAYRGITNSKAVGTIIVTQVTPMLNNLQNLKTLLVESSMAQFLDLYNKIPVEEGFFTFLRKLETVKLCGISNNLSLGYTLADFLALPKLRTLHIRDTMMTFEVPDADLIRAPIEDLRICTHRFRVQQLLTLFRGLSSTLRRMELQITLIIPDNGPVTQNNRVQAIVRVIEGMIVMENLMHLTLTKTFMKPSTTQQIFETLKYFTSLKTISFDTLRLNDISDLANIYLPKQTKCIIITESIRIENLLYSINAKNIEFYDVFNDQRMPLLRNECRKVNAEITVQFGRLRGFEPPAINFAIGQVKVLANEAVSGKKKGDYRVFLWKGHILTRSEYLKLSGIDLSYYM